jgi:hypothetical protein
MKIISENSNHFMSDMFRHGKRGPDYSMKIENHFGREKLLF